jgi:catechol 2,3-dioxygenase-like lactoylglutathione lyase family enzyme
VFAAIAAFATLAGAAACSERTAAGTGAQPAGGVRASPTSTPPASAAPPADRSPAADAAIGLAGRGSDSRAMPDGDSSAAADASSQATSPIGPAPYCSGCAQEQRDTMDTSIHLHHVHMNVANRETSAGFYEQHLAATRVRLNDVTEALRATPVLLLLDETQTAPVSTLPTALQHVGWGSKDVGAWYELAHSQGVAPDTRGGTLFNTDTTPTIAEPGGNSALGLDEASCLPAQESFSYMYVLGPDSERIEVWTGEDLRVNHVHFTTANLAATTRWYQRFLGITTPATPDFYTFLVDDIVFFFEPIGRAAEYGPTDDHVLGHIAFSVTDLAPWLARAAEQQIEVVAQPAAVHGFESFFVRGPDGLLIELVQAAPNAELCPAKSAPRNGA